jgi:hypothetical protein
MLRRVRNKMHDWYIEVKRIYDFHQKKVEENGKHENLGRSGKSGWSMSDTATAMSLSKGKVSEALRLYRYASKNKECKELPERRAAISLMKYRS